MLAAIDAAQVAIIVSIVGLGAPFLTYLGLRRKASGRIGASEAETLWAEAEKMRAIYREEATTLRAETLSLRENVIALRREVVVLHEESDRWQARALELIAAAEAEKR